MHSEKILNLFAKKFLKILMKDGLMDDDYLNKRSMRYLEEIESKAVKKDHSADAVVPKKPRKKRVTKKQREQDALRLKLKEIENDTKNEI